jgi:alkaline phosphatase D
MTYSDVDFFLMDSRWFRVSDTLKDSLNGRPNAEKLMFGKQQMAWFKKAMRASKANPNIKFRIIANGGQMLNTLYKGDAFYHYPVEYQEMLDFLMNEKINGVLFLTGDRHLSEIIKRERPGTYTLFDVTSSPLTADPVNYNPNERVNPSRIVSIPGKFNYSRLSFSGKGLDRKLRVEFIGTTGDKLGEWSTRYGDLRF